MRPLKFEKFTFFSCFELKYQISIGKLRCQMKCFWRIFYVGLKFLQIFLKKILEKHLNKFFKNSLLQIPKIWTHLTPLSHHDTNIIMAISSLIYIFTFLFPKKQYCQSKLLWEKTSKKNLPKCCCCLSASTMSLGESDSP